MQQRGADIPHKKQARSHNGKNYLLAIGIDQYEHWPALHNAVRDAKDLVRILTTQYQFEQEHIHELYDSDATEGKIYDAIRDLKKKMTEQDSLLVYYSGHGHYDKDFGHGHWVPVGAHVGNEDRYISNANILTYINALEAHHILMIVDSCFSGSLVVPNRSFIVDENYRSRRILSSGRMEVVSDGRPGENSPFAGMLLTRLKRNTDASVTTTDLIQYVKKTIVGKSRQSPVDGRIQNSQDEGGEFVFHLKVNEAELWNRIQQKGTAQAYENYLSTYPEGQYVARARQQLLTLKEGEFWRGTQQKDNEQAYRDYLKRYAGQGKHLEEAQRRLDELHSQYNSRRSQLEDLAEKEAKREEIQHRFQRAVQRAEQLFAKRQLKEAREYYRQALPYYMQGFAPDYDYLERQINICSNGINFLHHYEGGQEALKNKNYRLAIQYFTEANNISSDPKLDELISICEKRMKKPSGGQQAYASSRPQKKKKSRGGLIAAFIVGGILVFIILYAIGSAMEDYEGEGYVEEEIYPLQGTSNETLIIGSWVVTDVIENGVSLMNNPGIDTYGMRPWLGMTVNFKANNQVEYIQTFEQNSGLYYVSGTDFTFSDQGGEETLYGSIYKLDGSYLELLFYLSDGFGNQVPLAVQFVRQ